MAAEIERRGAIRPISDLPAAAMVEGTDLVELEHAGHFYKVTASAFATAGLVATLTLGNYLSGGSYNGSVNVTTNVLAASANTANYVVARDASGNFAAGDVTVAHLIAGTDPGGTDLLRVGGTAFVSGRMGIGGAPAADRVLSVTGTLTSGLNQFGAVVNPIFTSSATSGAAAWYSNLRTQAAAFAMTAGYGALIDVPELGVGSSIGTLYGLYVANQALGGTNYSIYTAGGQHYFGDKVRIEGHLGVLTPADAARAIDVRGTVVASGGIAIALNLESTVEAVANANALRFLSVQPSFTPHAFTGLFPAMVSLNGFSTAGFVSPASAIGLDIGTIVGTGAPIGYGIRIDPPSGATANYFIGSTTPSVFNVNAGGLGTFGGGVSSTAGTFSTSLVVGSDPGGGDIFRVGGSATLSAGTNASTHIQIGTGGSSPSATRQNTLTIAVPDSVATRGRATLVLQRASTTAWEFGTFEGTGGAITTVTDFAIGGGAASGTFLAISTNGNVRIANGSDNSRPALNIYETAGADTAWVLQQRLGTGAVPLTIRPLLFKNIDFYIAADGNAAGNENFPGALGIITASVGATNARGSQLSFVSTRSTFAQLNAATFTAVQTDDQLGTVSFGGDNGVNIRFQGAQIQATAASIWTNTNTEGQLVFWTTGNGATTPTARWRIRSTGDLAASTDNSWDLGTTTLRPRTVYAATSVVIATDPGGTDALRVGGAITFTTTVSSTTSLTTPSAYVATTATLFANTSAGATIMGFGSTNDVTIKNRAGTTVQSFTANTTSVSFAGQVTVNGTLIATSSMQINAGNLGIGVSALSTRGINMTGTTALAGAGVSQEGVYSSLTFPSGTTTRGTSIYGRIITAAAAFTMASGIGLNIDSPSLGAGSAITTLYGIKVENQTAGGTNYAIFTGTGIVALGDTTIIGTDPGGTNLLRVGGAARIGGQLTVDTGTDVTQTALVGQGGSSPAASRQAQLKLNPPSSVTNLGIPVIFFQRDSGSVWVQAVQTGTSGGAIQANTDLGFQDASSGTYKIAFTTGGNVRLTGSLQADIHDTLTATDLLLKRNGTLILTLGAATATFAINTITNGNADFVLQRNAVTKLTLGNTTATFADSITTAAPGAGAAKPWKLGQVNAVSPTAPNRTLTVDVDGTVYYIHCKTTDD